MARRKRNKPVDTASMSIETLALMPGMVDVTVYDTKTSLFRPGRKRRVFPAQYLADQWVQQMQAQGFLSEEDLEEQQGMVRAALRANAKAGEYDPASVANKKSGYGTKPSRKPTRDYKMPASVANNGNPTGRVSYGKGWTPA